MMNEKLTGKQEMFCQEYIIDFNATQAAIRAGYSEKTAYSIGQENLNKPEIQARIAELKKVRMEKLGITQERVLQEYARIAFLDISKLYDENGNMLEPVDMDEDTRRAIGGVEVTKSKDPKNPDEIHKVRLIDKKGALDSVAKHLGMFEEKINVKGGIDIKVEKYL